VTILGDEIPWTAFNYGVNCHRIKLRLNSALIFIVTAKSEGLFPPLEGCVCLLRAVIIVMNSFLAQYFETLIVNIFSFPVEILLWQSYNHHKSNNDIISTSWNQSRVLFPPLGVLVGVLDGCTVETTWELRCLLRDARGLSGESGTRCKCNARRCERSLPRVLNPVSRLVVHEVPGSCAWWRLGRFVFVNQRNAGYESKVSHLASRTKESLELENIYPFFPPTPPVSFPPISYTPPASWTTSTSRDLPKTAPLVPKHTR